MKISIHTQENSFDAHIQYVLDFLSHHPYNTNHHLFLLNSDEADINIGYDDQSDEKSKSAASYIALIPRQGLLFSLEIIDTSKLVANQFVTKTKEIYSVETESKKPGIFYNKGKFSFDWIETLFFHLSRYEEYYCTKDKKDSWDMMWEKEQFLCRQNLQVKPVVDHLVGAIFSVLKLDFCIPHTTFSMTHDVDVLLKYKSPYRFFRALGRELLDKKSIISLIRSMQRYWNVLKKNEKDPFDTFEFLFLKPKEEQKLKHKIVYFMAGGETKYDNFYKIDSLRSREILAKAKKCNYEIGLHPSYNTDKNNKLFLSEKKKLEMVSGEKVKSSRQHFLHYSFNDTPSIIENAGIVYDSSLGYQRKIGFRCGTGFAYSLFNFKEKRPFMFKESPMIIMDGALLNEADDDIERASEIMTSFIDSNIVGTHITINFHNTIFDPMKREVEPLRNLYLHLVNNIIPNNI